VTEFKYGAELGKAFRGKNPIKYLKNFGMSKTYSKFPISVKLFIVILRTDRYGLLNFIISISPFERKKIGDSPHFNCFEIFAYFGNIL